MTDQEIRELVDVLPENVGPLLKELLSYRALNFAGWWRVWCPDPAGTNWRPLGAFPTQHRAYAYRDSIPEKGCLVLFWTEQPSETAR